MDKYKIKLANYNDYGKICATVILECESSSWESAYEVTIQLKQFLGFDDGWLKVVEDQ